MWRNISRPKGIINILYNTESSQDNDMLISITRNSYNVTAQALNLDNKKDSTTAVACLSKHTNVVQHQVHIGKMLKPELQWELHWPSKNKMAKASCLLKTLLELHSSQAAWLTHQRLCWPELALIMCVFPFCPSLP